MLKIDHKLGNFHLKIEGTVSNEKMPAVLGAGVKKLVDGAASAFFKRADGKQMKDRRVEAPFSEASGSALAGIISAALATYGSFTCAAGARAWTQEDPQVAAFARFAPAYAAMRGRLGDAEAESFARLASGYAGPLEGPAASPAAPAAPEAEQGAEEQLGA